MLDQDLHTYTDEHKTADDLSGLTPSRSEKASHAHSRKAEDEGDKRDK